MANDADRDDTETWGKLQKGLAWLTWSSHDPRGELIDGP